MAAIIKHVKPNGSGDYTDLVSGISGIIASGASIDEYCDMYLYVDEGIYSGVINATIPNSGSLSIICTAGSIFYPTSTSHINGTSYIKENLILKGLDIYNKYLNNDYSFIIGSGCSVKLEDVDANLNNVFINSGNLELNNVSLIGSGVAINSSSNLILREVNLSDYSSGIISTTCDIFNTYINNCSVGIYNTGTGVINRTLLIDCGTGCYNTGMLSIYDSTLHNTIDIQSVSGILDIQRSITNIAGSHNSGNIYSVNLYPSGSISGVFTSLTSGVITYYEPNFNDSSNGDFRLKFKDVVGSKLINYEKYIYSGIYVSNDTSQISMVQFSTSNVPFYIPQNSYLNFIYKQGSTSIISDYNREVQFASFIKQYEDISIKQLSLFTFSETNVPTVPSFSINTQDSFPWDWDYKEIYSTQIGVENGYIIPRSVVNIRDIIVDRITTHPIRYDLISANSISILNRYDYRGISYDSDISQSQNQFIWMLEGLNQSLIKQNAYTGEVYETYPLLSPDVSSKYFIKPSGLIYTGKVNNRYQYVYENDPSKYIYTDNFDGRFRWISTELNPVIDFRGVRSFNDKIFLTCTEYAINIQDRSIIPSGIGIGKIYMYNNNDLFSHFIYSPSNINGPKDFKLDNNFPTDITFDESGSILVLDYYQSGLIYKYKLMYDYALIESNYDRDTQILLREYYPNVEI